jgi:hypothetical protein
MSPPNNKKKVSDAEYDLKFLLNRRYKKKNALAFVSNKYLLNRDERNYLGRKIYSNEVSMHRMVKIQDIEAVKNKNIFVDGYNVLITTEIICNHEYDTVIMCDDGVLRDFKAVFGNYNRNKTTEKALTTIINLLNHYKPLSINFFYDSPVSKSGALAMLTNQILKKYEVYGTALTNKNVDFEIVKQYVKFGGVVATSDGVIIDSVEEVIDIPYWICKIAVP